MMNAIPNACSFRKASKRAPYLSAVASLVGLLATMTGAMAEAQAPLCAHFRYADPEEFSEGFPSALIQGGPREVFLSDVVRLYQSPDQSGPTVNLDLHDGMPHVFRTQLPETLEAQVAMGKVAQWVVTPDVEE